MNIRYRVELTEAERAQLMAMLSGGRHAARKLKRAQILLAAETGVGDEEIARSVSVGGSTVYRTKRRFVEGNLDLALSEEGAPGRRAQAVRQGDGTADRYGVLGAAGRSQALDAGSAGRCHGAADRARGTVA